MSVALASTPDLFALTKGGRMVYDFTGSGRLATTGVKAVNVLFCSAAVPAGTSVTLRWNGKRYTLTFVDAPAEATEFYTGDGGAFFVDNLLTQLQGFFPLREDFVISRYDRNQLPGVVLTAKKPGKAYNIVVDNPVGSVFTGASTVAGADPLLRDRYSVYCELWLQKVGSPGTDQANDFERVYSTFGEFDSAGKAQFDVGNVLHAKLTADRPDWQQHLPVVADQSARKYYLIYAEAYGTPLAINRLHQDPQVRQVYLGGNDYVSRAAGALSPFSYRQGTPGDDAALRFGSFTRYVRPDEPQFLSFVNTRGDQPGATLHITRTFDNDSTDIVAANGTATDFLTGTKLVYCVGPAQQEVLSNLPAGRLLKEYSVQLVSAQQTALSVVYRYILNYDYQPYTRFFVYLNSLGCFDTLTTFGKGSAELTRFFEQAEQYLPALYEVADGQFTEYDVAVQQQYTVTTGYRPEAELKVWTDFYRSPVRFHLVDGQPLPLGITSKSIKKAKDGDTLFAHSFEFVYLFHDEFYSTSTGEITGALPPVGFQPVGTVLIQAVQVVNSVDRTISNAVRNITPAQVDAWNTKAAEPSASQEGYITQSTGNQLYRTKTDKVPYAEVSNKPTTRDTAGLSDVPTKTEVAAGTAAGLRRIAPEQNDSVQQASALLVYQTIQVDGKDVQVSAPMDFSTAAGFIFQNATSDQLTWLVGKIKPTLDQVLAGGNESDREEIIKASQRKTIQLEESLVILSGRLYDPARRLYLERQISAAALIKQFQAGLDIPALKLALASSNTTTGATPDATDWRFGDLLTCEDQFKEFSDDLDNKDFQ